MSDIEKKNNESIPDNSDLLMPQIKPSSDLSEAISPNQLPVEAESVLKSFFPPEVFEQEQYLKIKSLRQKGMKNNLIFFLSILFCLIVVAIFFPRSRLYRSMFSKPSVTNLKIEQKGFLQFSTNKFKNQINNIKNAFGQKQWNAVESKSRELLFNKEVTDPEIRRWLFQIRLEAFIELGRWINVEGTAMSALREFPDFYNAYFYAALAASKRNEFDTAKINLEKFQSSLKYPIAADLEEKLNLLDLKISVGKINFDTGARFDSAAKMYYYPECDRIVDLFDKIEKQYLSKSQNPPAEYFSIKQNFFILMRNFLSDSLFSKKTISIKGRIIGAGEAKSEIDNIQKQMYSAK